jgi:hypothetical protein
MRITKTENGCIVWLEKENNYIAEKTQKFKFSNGNVYVYSTDKKLQAIFVCLDEVSKK